MSEKILLSSVSYVTPLGQSPSYFRQWEDSALAPSATRRVSVPPHQRPEPKYYGQNSSSATRGASCPSPRAGSRDCGCMVRGLARRRCGIIISQHTAIRRERLLDHTGSAECPTPTACCHWELGESDVL